MRRLDLVVTMLALAAIASCTDRVGPTDPTHLAPTHLSRSAASSLKPPAGSRVVQIFDQCEPNSFNAALGPGACVRKDGGSVTYQRFLAQVQ